MEDVGVEHMQRVDDERAGHPRNVPDQKPRIGVIEAADRAEVKCQRGREDDGHDPIANHDERQLTPAMTSDRHSHKPVVADPQCIGTRV
jgi:hypothetical protein